MSSSTPEPAERSDEGLATGTDAGTPGEREAVAPDDRVTAAVQDDAPLDPATASALLGPDAAGGSAQDEGEAAPDGATPEFREP